MTIDYITPADRLGTSLAAKRARANAYLDDRHISVLRHGFTPTPAHATDIVSTIVRACPDWIKADRDTPVFLRRQAA
jgi:hypothetical protein